MDLPEGAELVADVVKKDTKEAKEDLKLAEEAAGRYEITGYQIYDLHFEKNNKEIELTPREKADIKVTVVIDKKANMQTERKCFVPRSIWHLRT